MGINVDHNRKYRARQRAMNPKRSPDWFLRRVYLEGRLDDFLGFQNQMIESGVADTWKRAFWPAAQNEIFNYSDVEGEKEKCRVLEALDKKNRSEELMARKRRSEEKHEYDENVSYFDSVKWAFENWPTYVSKRGDENVIINEAAMRRSAPSRGAVGMIQFACDNLKEFQALCARVLSKNQQEINPDENPNRDEIKDSGTEDLEAILKGL